MALLAVEGVYENGKVELAEQPADVQKARVVVTFLPEDTVTEEERRRLAGERLLASMHKGINFGGEKFDRNEVYEERIDELERRRQRG